MEASSPIRDFSGNHVITSTSIMKILLPFVLAMLTLPLPATPASSAEGQTAFGHWTAPDEINSSLYRGELYAFWLPVPDYSLAFQGRPTPRVDAIRKVAGAWTSHKNLLGQARLEDSGVDVVYFRESGWAENLMCPEGDDRYEARRTGASMKSAVSCFRALTERGLNVGLRSADEYDFSPDDFSGRTMIISNQICIPWKYRPLLGKFVSGGGTLIVEGLSAFYDEYLRNTMTTVFMFRDLFGCNVSGFVIRDSVFAVRADSLSLPAFPWHGILESSPAMTRGASELTVSADREVSVHDYGRGKVVWCPSNIALGARETGDYAPLSDSLYGSLPDRAVSSVRFSGYQDSMLLRTLRSGDDTIVICINKSGSVRTVTLDNIAGTSSPDVIFRSKASLSGPASLTLAPEGVLAVCFH